MKPDLLAAAAALVAVLALHATPADAAGTDAKTAPAKATPAKPVVKATSREQLRNQAKGLAVATEAVEQVNERQLAAASQVNQGDADCEFKQQVRVQAVADKPGHFNVGFKKREYLMVVQETTSGAIRLEDKKTGLVWIQIPAKSMLMDAKRGQRMVDGCLHQPQKDLPPEPSDAASASALGITGSEAAGEKRP